MDETGIDNRSCYRKHAWSKRGEKIYTENLTGKEYIRTSIIGGLRYKKPTATFSFIGNTNTEIFNFWVEYCLCPVLEKDDVVIIDNAKIHKSPKAKELIESKGAIIKFLPPYSPFLNKIEFYWAFIKKMIGVMREKYDKFIDCLDAVFRLKYGTE